MIFFTRGNILACPAKALVNPVNCKGKAGKGLAKLFCEAFPGLEAPYQKCCAVGKLAPGGIQVVSNISLSNGVQWVVNAATKDHWRDPSRKEWVLTAMDNLAKWCFNNSIESIAIPALGCGLGGLKWKWMKLHAGRIFRELQHTTVIIYGPA